MLMTAGCYEHEATVPDPGTPSSKLDGTEASASLSLMGEGSRLSITVPSEGSGSRGVAFHFKVDPSKMQLLRVEARTLNGQWTLRVGSGSESPNWLPMIEPACVVRVTGAKEYEVLIYSDDPGARIDLVTVSMVAANEGDGDRPLVWPLSDPSADRGTDWIRQQWVRVFEAERERTVLGAAKAVARFVHNRSKVGTAPVPRATFTPLGSSGPWLCDPDRTVDGSCGNFADAMIDGCGQLGIVARPVSLGSQRFYEGAAVMDTHVLVEVFDPALGRWILLDPTFNLCFQTDDGEELGLAQLMQLQRSGRAWRAAPLGPVRLGRGIDEYYLPYRELFFMAQAPAVPQLGAAGVAIQTTDLPFPEVIDQKYKSPR